MFPNDSRLVYCLNEHHLMGDFAKEYRCTPSPMSKKLNAFLEKVKTDASLQEKLKAAAS